MTEVRILTRVPFRDLSRGPPGVEKVMVLFQLSDLRQGTVVIDKGQERTSAEDAAIRSEIERMGRPAGEYRTV